MHVRRESNQIQQGLAAFRREPGDRAVNSHPLSGSQSHGWLPASDPCHCSRAAQLVAQGLYESIEPTGQASPNISAFKESPREGAPAVHLL